MPSDRSVSLVVPVYNEERSLSHLLDFAVPALERHAQEFEIVLVDDASTDSTPALASERAAADPRIRVVRHAENRGLGGALKSGFAAARLRWILYTDCDLPWDPEETGRLFRAVEITGADFVSGYRHAAFSFPIRDVNFSCKLFRRSLLEGMPFRSEGSFIDAELLVRCRNRGATIQQIGLDYFPRTRGVSTLSSPRVILRILKDFATLVPELRRERKALLSR